MIIYAEALNKISYPSTAAFAALNAVRTNAGISPHTPATLTSQAEFRTVIYKERRLELALKLDRWFDIVRTGQMPVIFPLVNNFRRYYPVLQTEIQNITNQQDGRMKGTRFV